MIHNLASTKQVRQAIRLACAKHNCFTDMSWTNKEWHDKKKINKAEQTRKRVVTYRFPTSQHKTATIISTVRQILANQRVSVYSRIGCETDGRYVHFDCLIGKQ